MPACKNNVDCALFKIRFTDSDTFVSMTFIVLTRKSNDLLTFLALHRFKDVEYFIGWN